MERDKLLSMLGLCRKAGRLIQGNDAVIQAASEGKLSLIIIADDISERSLSNMKHIAEKFGIPLEVAPVTIKELSERTGKAAGILGVADSGFSEAIRKILAMQVQGG